MFHYLISDFFFRNERDHKCQFSFVFHRPEPEPEVIYLRHVERARPHPRHGEEDRVYPPPQFIVPLRDISQTEDGKIHFEGRIEPVGDPSMYVEWFLNGRPLTASMYSIAEFSSYDFPFKHLF